MINLNDIKEAKYGKFIDQRRDYFEIQEAFAKIIKRIRRAMDTIEREHSRHMGQEQRARKTLYMAMDEFTRFMDMFANKLLEVRKDDR